MFDLSYCTYPCKFRWVRIVKCFPYSLFQRLPGVSDARSCNPPRIVTNFASTARYFNFTRAAVDIFQVRILIFVSWESLKFFFGVSVFVVFCPTTRFNLFLVQTPEVKLFLKERAAHIPWTMKFSRAIEVQNMRKNRGVPIEEKFALLSKRSRILKSSLCYPCQASVGYTGQRTHECFVFLSSDVQIQPCFSWVVRVEESRPRSRHRARMLRGRTRDVGGSIRGGTTICDVRLCVLLNPNAQMF